MKKLLALVLCAMTLCTLIGSAALAEEPDEMWIGDHTISWWIPMDGKTTQYFEDYSEHPFFQWMHEKTGVTVEFYHYAIEQKDTQLQLMINSDNYYDMLFDPWYTDGPQNAINDGIFQDIYEYRDIMPHYFQAVTCGDGSYSDWEWGEEAALYRQAPQPAFDFLLTTVQGQMWTVSQVWTDAYTTECGGLIRQDWLDEAGLEMPTTVEELDKVLEAFAARGEDVIPMTMDEPGFDYSGGWLCSAYDFFYNWYYVKDGVVQPGNACGQPCLKAYIEQFSDWFNKGYIDPDFMNREYASKEALLLTDRLGIFPDCWSSPEYYEALYTGDDPDYKLAAMPIIRMTEDQDIHWMQSYGSQNSNNACVYPGNGNAEICCRYLDAMFTKEATIRAEYGVEGESFVYDENGHPYYTEWFYENYKPNDLAYSYLRPSNVVGYVSVRAYDLRQAVDTSIEGQKTVSSDWFAASSVWGANADADYVIGYVTFDDTGWGDMYTPYTNAETYYTAEVLKLLTGKTDISEFETISQTAWDMGYHESRDLMQAAYNVQHQQAADYGMDYQFGE